MKRAQALSMILLTAAIIFFAAQNLDSVEVTFLFWTFYVPLSLITLVPLLVGLLVGWVSSAVGVKRRERKAPPQIEPETEQPPREADAGVEFKDEEEIPR
jgi:uncharacterized integral membrane protein